jgi:membrane associated rhomboid family serine protease
MIIPIRTDYRRKHIPWVNYAIILANAMLFITGYNGASEAGQMRISNWMLDPDLPRLGQFFSCMFLHANWAHLLGNMIFLWVFGNAVNDKLGQAGYLAFYLGGGVFSGLGYLLLSGNAPVLGASGAIAAVAGAYLVLLPRTNITLIVWLFYLLLPVDVSSLYFIAFQFVFEIFMTAKGWAGPASGGVAYAAHATGYLFGIGVSALLLAARLLPRDDFDMLHLLEAHRRRRQFHRLVRSGYDPFTGQAAKDKSQPDNTRPDQDNSPEVALRGQIAQAFAARDIPSAAALYVKLSQLSPGLVLSRQQQLDIANQLMAQEQYDLAAEAYQRFTRQYPNYEYMPDIQLMLGLLHGRYLRQPDLARKYLAEALSKLTDENKRSLARTELEAAEKHAGQNP